MQDIYVYVFDILYLNRLHTLVRLHCKIDICLNLTHNFLNIYNYRNKLFYSRYTSFDRNKIIIQ